MAESPKPSERFSRRAADYASARPQYPDAVVGLLEAEIGLSSDELMADIGSGTGISAEPFLRSGYTVACVEPNPDMRAAAELQLGMYPGFRSVAGSAEDTGLSPGSIGCILAAQAFHWFEAERARQEFRRISTENGRVVLMWNTRRSRGTPFLEAYEELLQRFGTDYHAVLHRTARASGGDATAGGDIDRLFDEGYERRVLENWQELDLEGLRSRLRSSSYVPAEGTPGYEPIMEAAVRLFEEHAVDGRVRLEYDLEIFLAR